MKLKGITNRTDTEPTEAGTPDAAAHGDWINRLQKILLNGIEPSDQQGHSERIQIRVRPQILSVIAKIREQYPERAFETSSKLFRGLLAVGIDVVMEILLKNSTPETKAAREWLEQISTLSRHAEINRLRAEIAAIKREATTRKQKDNVEELEAQIIEVFGS